MTRRLKNAAKRGLQRLFRLGQRVGVDILPRHFYSSIPDLRFLEHNDYWRKPFEMVGVEGADLQEQLSFVRQCCTSERRAEIAATDLFAYATAENGEIGYGPVEADFLYCFIATKRPPKIVQVGAGFSTAIILRAAAAVNHAIELICIDPFPTDYLKRVHRDGKIKLIPEMAQTVDRSVLTNVGEGGMLFIDSTHTVKVGSEVNRLVLDVLPRLQTGAYVHLHDIYFPYDYQRRLLWEPLFPMESTLVHAFLIGNSRYRICCSQSMLHYGASDELKVILPRYQPQAKNDGLADSDTPGHFPCALYLQVVA